MHIFCSSSVSCIQLSGLLFLLSYLVLDHTLCRLFMAHCYVMRWQMVYPIFESFSVDELF
jgi:hypothetical protein